MHVKCRERLTNYAAIGFDMDHTFVRYKLRNFINLVYNSTAKYLVDHKNYPQEIFPKDKAEAERLYSMFFRAVFDHRTGDLLKIGWGNVILRGFYGMQKLTNEEIVAKYGAFPQIPDYQILSHRHEDFTNLHEFYSCAIVPVLARIIELRKHDNFSMLQKKSYFDIMDEIKDSWDFNYGVDRQEFQKGNYSGNFFPMLMNNPHDIVFKTRQQIIMKLREIRQKGVTVFISSNSSYEVADVLMKESVGDNWLDHFDFVLYENKKPNFFRQYSQYPKFSDYNDKVVNDFTEFARRDKIGLEKVLLKGHAQYLNQYFENKAGKNFKVLFFGDTIVSDCVYSYDKKHSSNWDCAFILEELQELGDFNDKDYYDYRDVWGSALKEKNPYTDEDCTLIYHFARHVANHHFQRFDSFACLDFLTL